MCHVGILVEESGEQGELVTNIVNKEVNTAKELGLF
jgi:hypothetical protein